jgi:hypothetical protein
MSGAALLGMLVSALWIGCRTDAPSGQTHTETIRVERELVVGFFPHVADEQVAASEGLRSALEHFGYALHDTSKCLEERGIEVRAVHADEIVFEDGDRRTSLDLREVSNDSIGCAFVAPGKEPEVVKAAAGPSSLIATCPATASIYFGIPACCPEFLTCCADGTLMAEEAECAE